MDDAPQAESRGEAFERYCTLLFSIAYRMTGSASDAEDLVQEAYLRYQASGEQKINSLKAYLSTIITRLALDYLKSAHVVREQYIGTWLPEPILTSDESDSPAAGAERREALSLAVLRLLEALSPPERAVFLLHEVFDYPFNEIAEMLEKSPANCRQIFHRAQQALHDERARFDSEPKRQRQLLFSFLAATQAGDMDALTHLLAQDAISWADGGGKVQSILRPIHGQQAVARFWLAMLGPNHRYARPLDFTLAEINGSPAIVYWDEGRVAVVISLTLGDEGIHEIYALLNPDKLAYLQRQLASAAERDSRA